MAQVQELDKDSIIIRRYYERNTILWTGKKKYFKDNQSYPLKNIVQEFEFSKEALVEYNQYKKYQRRSWVAYGLSLGFFATSVLADRAEIGFPALGATVIGFGFFIGSQQRGLHHFQRAIWVHNRDVLLR